MQLAQNKGLKEAGKQKILGEGGNKKKERKKEKKKKRGRFLVAL